MGAELVRGRVGWGPSLLGAEMSSYQKYQDIFEICISWLKYTPQNN